ncbi:CAAX amino terminal protease [Parasponia andersonii]|uniref:intramembrane prenyl-peptidase Rce1 n=1 Tax=Parasponia andersonii TaxID=3476 RepID=A0A2P5B0W9_PARAD|nr:CAAX amino terminal protease [Parasponia andersonii]
MEEQGAISKPVAAGASAAMALLYVAILYSPTLVLRLPPPSSFKDFMIRRFICAATSSFVSIVICFLILPPVEKLGSIIFTWRFGNSIGSSGEYALQSLLGWAISVVSNILAWRNYVVAPLTEELVFRACMIPLLLCGGFRINSVIFLCPVFFSLAHLNHFMEVYSRQNYNLIKSSLAVGFQLGYTLIFGSYASFLFIRTGHLLAPLVAHICCNFMGLPVVFSRSKGIVSVAFLAGMVGFLWLLFPFTRPDLYNDRTNNCRCWHGYCSWSEPIKSSL